MKKIATFFVVAGLFGFVASAGAMPVAFPFLFPPPPLSESVSPGKIETLLVSATFREDTDGHDAGHWGEGDTKIYQVADGDILYERSGWKPHDAREFLTDKGLRTGDYHQTPGYEDWWSGLVKKITLYGYFVDTSVSDDVLEKFTEIAIILCERAIGGDINYISENLANRKYFEVDMGTVTVSLVHKRFRSEIGFNLTLEIEIK